MAQQGREKVLKQMQAKSGEIVSLADAFCKKHLFEEGEED